MKKFLVFLLLFPVLALADAVIFSGTDVKALKQNLDLFGVVKVMSGNVDPSAGAGVAAPVGSAYLSTVHGLFLKTGVTNTGWTKNALLPVDLTSEVTGVLPVTSGGTGVADVPTNGEIPIGNGTNYTITTLTGTANQVSVTNGAGSITLATPQDIATTSTPTFDEVTLNNTAYGPLNVGDKINRLTGTYLISGGVLSVNANPALFNLSAGVGYIADKSNPASPTLKTVAWSAFTGVTVTNLATADVTYILINNTGNIVQQTTYPTAQQRRDNIFIGRLPHINRTNISFALSLAEYGQGGINQLYDLFDSLGPFRINGLNVSANGSNLKINLSSGEMFSRSYNYPTTPENPNEVAITGSTASTFRYGTQTTFIQTNVTDIVPSSYDNAGTVTTVPSNNNATIQRVYLFPTGAIRIYYGQNVYANFAAAIDNFSNDSFIENPNSQNFATHIASIVITKSCTSLLDTTCSRIVNTGKFGSGGSTGGGSTTLQQAYNNSTTPQITTSTSGGSLDIRRGSAADTDNVLRIQNGAGSATATITGAGVITGSNLSGTNTGDTEIGNDAGNIGVAKEFDFPNSQIVQTDSTNKKFRIESGNNNELYNGGFEAETLAVGWTVSNATSSSSTTRIEGSKSLSLALTGALSLSQSSTINAAQKSGVQMVASIWVNSSDVSDLQLCSLKNGAEDKCTVTGGYVQGSGWRQLTVSFLGDSTSNGLKLKSTDTTGTVLVDQAYVGLGSPVVDFTPDMVYSAKVSSAGVVSDENTDWISSCTWASAGVGYCNFNAGIFTVAPNCTATINIDDSTTYAGNTVSNITKDYLYFRTQASPSGSVSRPLIITCQKQGADYKTSKAYVASGSVALNTTEYTAQISSTGVVSGENTDWLAAGPFTPTSTSVYSLTINSGIFTVAPHCTATTLTNDTAISVRSVSTTNVTVWLGFPGVSNIAGSFFIKCSKTGADYTSSFNPVIVGSFQGYNETPGTSRVETFSVSYGTTAAGTVCSASPCSYLDQIGTNFSSITRSTNGDYTMNLSKTYSKLKCTASVLGASTLATVASGGGTIGLNCTNCNSMRFLTGNPAVAYVDTFGTIMCQGIPQ